MMIIVAVAFIASSLTAQPREASTKSIVYISPVSVDWIRVPTTSTGVGVVRVVLANYGLTSLLGCRAYVHTSCGVDLIGEQPILLGSWEPGSSKSLDLALNTSKLVSGCELRITVHYEATATRVATGYRVVTIPGSASVAIPLRRAAKPLLILVVDPEMLQMNTVNEVRVTLVNKGFSTALDLEGSVKVSGGALASVEAPVRITAAKLGPGESVSAAFNVVPTSSIVAVSLSLDYVNELGEAESTHLTASIPATTGGMLMLTVEPAEIPSRETRKIKLLVRNVGDEELDDVEVYLSPAQGSRILVKPRNIKLGSLKPEEVKIVDIEVKAPYGEVGARPLHYTITYRGKDGGVRSFRDYVLLTIIEEAEVAITSVEIVPSEPHAGSTILTSVTVMNLGSSTISGVNISLSAPPELKPLRKLYHYIGQLSPYTPTSVPFSLNATKPGAYTIVIRVDYIDYYGSLRSKSREIGIVVKQPTLVGSVGSRGGGGKKDSTTTWIVAILLVIVILALAMVWRRRRR